MNDRPAIPYGYSPERQTFPSYTDNRHLITFGPTRSGKGATVIVQTLLQAPHSIICVDPKGQNAAITARQRRSFGDVYVLNPFGLHTGKPWNLPKHKFNPLAHLSIESENVVADVGGLAEALILTEGKEPYFDNTARDLVKVLILHLLATKGSAATLSDMRTMLTDLAAREKPAAELLYDLDESPHPFIRQPAARFRDANSRDIISSINAAITQTAFLDDPCIAETLRTSSFSITQLKQKPTTVFLILPGRYMAAYARFFRLFITSAIDQLTAEAGGHRTLMILDEFATLQNLAAISKAFGFAAGYNLQLWAFLQDMPQLKAIYGDNVWESFLANAGLTQFFTPADMTTADYLQRRGGQTTGKSKGQSLSRKVGDLNLTDSWSETRVPVLPTEETMSLPRDAQIVFFAGVHGYAAAGRQEYWSIPRLQGLYDPDPFHT